LATALPLQGSPDFNLLEGAVEENHSDLAVSVLLKLQKKNESSNIYL